MSLLDQFKERYVLMERTRTPDGEGGFITNWTDGITIEMVLRHDSTMEARRAEKEGVTSTYTFLCSKNIALEFHDVVRRVSDGQYFRITSTAGESKTPPSASFDLTSVTAEKWVIQ